MLHIKELVLSKTNKYVSMSSLVNEAEEVSRSGDNSPIETGINGFKLNNGMILAVGGEPGIGKSSLLTSQVPTNLSRQGIEVHIFSFEMTAHDLIYKSLSRATLLCGGINYAKTHGEISSILDHEKDWTKKDKDVYSRAKLKTKLDSSQITIHSDEIYDRDYGRVLDISAFEKVAEERYMAGVKKQVFIIDYLQITPPEEDSNSSTTTEYLNMAMGKLKRIAKIYNVAVVILSSLNKESLTSKNDGLKSFRGSYRIGYASDAAAFMKYNDTGLGKNEKADFRNKEREKPFRRIQIEMLKSRYGSTNPINLIYCAPYSYFYQSMETARRYGLYFPTQENEFFTINDYKNSLSENDEGNNLEALEEKLPY